MEPEMTTPELDPCLLLDWDSAFFGRRIARVVGHHLSPKLIQAILSWCEEMHIECLYFLANSDDPQTVQIAAQYDFKLVDIQVTLQNQLTQADLSASKPWGGIIRPASPHDSDSLVGIAANSYTLSRFYYDRCFPLESSQSLYETWIRESCQGYAQAVLVAEADGDALGYVTCHLSDSENEARIGLLGIDQGIQGKGVGSSLVLSALDWFASNQQDRVNAVTQGRNIAAQRLYQRCGFLTFSVRLWYHKWFAACDV